MSEILEKFYKLGWQNSGTENKKSITLKKYGKKRIGIIKIDIESGNFVCYNFETNYYYERNEIRDIKLEELILVYKLICEMKNESKNNSKTK